MYRFFLRRARRSFAVQTAPIVLTLTLCSIVSCGGSVIGTTRPIEIPEESFEGLEECRSSELLSSNPPVYRCDSEHEALFATALQDCAIPEKFSHQATTRQLLVGVSNLHVIKQEPVSFGDVKALHTIANGIIDVDPVLMSTFTVRSEDCIDDVVIWRTDPGLAGSDRIDEFMTTSRHLAERIFSSTDSRTGAHAAR